MQAYCFILMGEQHQRTAVVDYEGTITIVDRKILKRDLRKP
jgi:hypothetical protein